MPELSYATGWYPWNPQSPIELGHRPYNYERVEICRAEYDAPQVVDPHSLHPIMNVADLWWRPVMPDDRPPTPPRVLPLDEAQALADRVWARQAPSSRWLAVPQGEAPTDGEEDAPG